MRVRESLLLVALVGCSPSRAGVESPKGRATDAEARGFDRGSAAEAMMSIDVQPCKAPGVPSGVGHVSVTFAADGTVVDARLDNPLNGEPNPFLGTPAAPCILDLFKATRITPFAEGRPVSVGRHVTIR